MTFQELQNLIDIENNSNINWVLRCYRQSWTMNYIVSISKMANSRIYYQKNEISPETLDKLQIANIQAIIGDAKGSIEQTIAGDK